MNPMYLNSLRNCFSLSPLTNPLFKHRTYLGPRLDTFFRLVTLFLGFQIIGRLIFLFAFISHEESLPTRHLIKAFFIGLRFDLRVSLMVSLPWLLLSFIPFFYNMNRKLTQRFWSVFYATVALIFIIFYAGDLGYYAYLTSRINITIFDFAQSLGISLGMLHETYNLFFWLPLILILCALHYLFLLKFVFSPELDWKPHWKTPQSIALACLTSVIIIVFGIYSSFNQFPLRWSQAFFSQNTFTSALALHPIHYIFDTAENPKLDFDKKLVEKYYDRVAEYLGVIDKDKTNLNFKRPVEATDIAQYLNSENPQKMNVIYVVMESFAAYKTGTFNNGAQPSPFFDELAKKSILFRNFYTPTEGTARSMFCLLTGIPDINSKSTSSRNPLVVNQNTLVNAFQKHEKFYFIGGNATWGNIRGVYQNNIDNLKIYEDGSYESPNTDVWGLSDLDLFRETAKTLNRRAQEKSEEPFFAIVQSASFHRPYTIPKERGGFQLAELSPEKLKKYGFNSNEEYNSFRFSDYSLGQFIKLIENEKWFQNTIIVVHGDHGLPHEGAEHLGLAYKRYNLNRFHVPLVIYSPKLKAPLEIEEFATEPDVMPTLVGITGHQATNTTLGRNLLAKDKKVIPRYAFSYVYYSQPLQVLLYDKDYLAFGDETSIERLHLISGPNSEDNIKDQNPDQFQQMHDLLMGLFHTSKYMIFHNPKIKQNN
jgi:phosphoglycerol transferase MdoB-like AlkP superfamily enzyme